MSFITAIGTANPPHKIAQSQIANFMLGAMQLNNGDARRLQVVFKSAGIDTRHAVLSDYGRSSGFDFYANTIDLNPFPSTKKRNHVFRELAPALSSRAASQALQQGSVEPSEITHLITVSCTGMYAPGLDIDLVNMLRLPGHVQRTNIGFMGCYAAFNALKAADAFCKADSQAKVLVVCTELCSLHFQRESTDDNLLANALFADGSAAVLLEASPAMPRGLHITSHFSELARSGSDDMAWNIGDLGFEMKLSAYVPDIIREGIQELTARLLAKERMTLSDIQHFAIHPGGKKILEVIEEQLGLSKEQNRWAYEVLRQYGNMSSPTVLFVLKDIFDRLMKENDQEKILSFAFGPGLTLESMVFTYCHD
jgi:prepilin-type processing-associated H-X9-DG protein